MKIIKNDAFNILKWGYRIGTAFSYERSEFRKIIAIFIYKKVIIITLWRTYTKSQTSKS